MASSLNPSGTPRLSDASIDASLKTPVFLFAASAAAWLLLGAVMSVISSVKLHAPGFLGDIEWLTYGRTRGMESAALLYGWGFNAAFALALWLLARLSRSLLPQPVLLAMAAFFWNVGVAVGVGGILLGDGTSLEGLDMPAYAGPVLFVAYVFIGIWALQVYQSGRVEQVYISQWYLLAALFWFPWIFSLAQIMLFIDPVRGTVQTIVHTWFAQGLNFLWFLPIALGAIYYFLPKLLGRPIKRYYISVYGFWMLALFGGWAGLGRLTGSPVPAWVVSAGVGGALMLAVTWAVLAINLVPTVFGGGGSPHHAPGLLRFFVVSIIALFVWAASTIVLSLRSVAEITQFTLVLPAQSQLFFFGVFSLAALGGLYYLLPRVLEVEWSSQRLIGAHFWLSVIGLVLGVVALTLGGLKQGFAINALPAGQESPESLLAVMRQLIPFLSTQTLGATVLLLGHLLFVINLARTGRKACCCRCGPRSSVSVGYTGPKEAVIR